MAGDTSGSAPDDDAASTGFLRTDTTRVEAFSDAVFAIAITILALDMRTPEHRPDRLMSALLQQWPVYLGYVTSFALIGVIWLNHHQAYTRIRTVDRGLHAANLAILLTTSALAFPTGVVSDTIQADPEGTDARTAVILYGLIAMAMCAGWAWTYEHLARHPDLLSEHADQRYIDHGRWRSYTGIVGYGLGAALGWLIQPGLGLVVFLLLPVFYFFTTEGMPRFGPR
jgi:uncharacterized membrane protein